MPLVFDVQEEKRRVIVTATGSMTLRELTQATATVRVGDVVRYGILIDLTNASVPLTAGEVDWMVNYTAALRRVSGPRGAVAMVTPRDADYGMWRMFEIRAENADLDAIRAFRTVQEATRWLDEVALLPSLSMTDQHKPLSR